MKYLRIHKKKFLIILTIIIAIIISLGFLQHYMPLNSIKEYVSSFGNWAPLILFIMIIIASSIGFIFQMPVAVAALLLDTKTAFLISIAGLTIGAAISFLAARFFARDYVERKYINKMKRLREYDHHLHNHGFFTVLFLRFIAIIPYELINIVGGLSRIKFSHYIFATTIGIIPGVLMAIYFAKSTANVFTLNFLIALILNISFSVLPLISKRVRRIIFHGE